MAWLIVEHDGVRRGGEVRGRLHIGRRSANEIVIDRDGVSRLHAWIDQDGADCFISDAGSSSGTFVNGQLIEGRHLLRHGDTIRIGPARLLFCCGERPPPQISIDRFESTERDRGIFFDCACGMAFWAASSLGGRTARCARCNQPLTIPQAPTTTSPLPVAVASTVSTVAEPLASAPCSICQCPIEAGDLTTRCPECHLLFHRECWAENRGCSAYGCSQVNALATEDDEAKAMTAARAALAALTDEPPDTGGVPWPFLILGAAVFAALASLLLYGVPSMVVALAALIYLFRSQTRNRWALWTALALSLAGAAGGIVIARLW